MKKHTKPVMAGVTLLLVLFCIGFLTRVIRQYTPSTEVMDAQMYFSLANEKQAAVIIDDEILETKGKIEDGISYIDVQAVKAYLNDCFYWDEGESSVIFTTPTEIITIPVQETAVTVNGRQNEYSHPLVIKDGQNSYMALDFVEQYAGISYEMFHDPDRIVITRQNGNVTYASIGKNTKLRVTGGIKSQILREMEKHEVVRVVQDLEDWKGVMTQDGYFGYIMTKHMGEEYEETLTSSYEPFEYPDLRKKYRINMVWHQISSIESNYSVYYDVAACESVNVISPTWYSIESEDGSLASWELKDYVETAHDADMDVWGLVDNFSHDIDFAAVMNNTEARRNVEDQLIASAIENGLDGINVDFENIAGDAVDGFIQFMREMSVKCHSKKLVLSVDVPPPTYTAYYNRKALGEVCDYVIVMGYDEHYFGSLEAGSVASLPYEEAGINDTLEEVPAGKIISGIPFYTRIWETREEEDGSKSVTSEAVGMNAAQEVLEEHEVTPVWDSKTSQNYGSFYGKDGELCEIWLEDLTSMEKKLDLLNKYDLAGVAAWKLGLEDDSVWDLIANYVR